MSEKERIKKTETSYDQIRFVPAMSKIKKAKAETLDGIVIVNG
jgi:hypothetical protein